MTVGTRSILFGAHCWAIHPWFVARAWWKLNGFPWDPRLWVAFAVHDLGYWGKPNMDGEEGEWHPALGSKIMGWLFDYDRPMPSLTSQILGPPLELIFGPSPKGNDWYKGTWYNFCFYHSRFLAKRYGVSTSPLCVADKLAIALTPAWLYLPMANWSGEIHEYIAKAREGKYKSMNMTTEEGQYIWYLDVQDYLRRWVEEHKDGRADTWTPSAGGSN